MHLRTFTAPTTADAMNLVRDELGDDAVIVSTKRDKNGTGIHIIASLGGPTGASPISPAKETETRLGRLDIYETVCRALKTHGTPGPMVERLAHAAAALGAANPWAALAGALNAAFVFSPVPSARDANPIMLVGPAGAGKTLTTAKLAAKAVMAGQSVGVITTDYRRAGAIEQLSAFMRVLKVDLKTAQTPGDLALAVSRFDGRDTVYIDSAAVNPFLDGDMAGLSKLIAAAEVDPLLVLPAGGNALDATEIAQAFADIGTRRMIATRLDVARRIGCVLAAADHSRLAFSGVSITPRVAKGLSTINAVTLARLIMPRTARDAYEASGASDSHRSRAVA